MQNSCIQYQISAKIILFCQCEQCRKLTGSAYAANIVAHPESVNWLRDEHLVKRHDAPAGHVFCSNCGSGLPFMNVRGTTLFIPAGSLDSEFNLRVTRNIFWGEISIWYESGLVANRCTGFPE